jgi:hypothetical protein
VTARDSLGGCRHIASRPPRTPRAALVIASIALLALTGASCGPAPSAGAIAGALATCANGINGAKPAGLTVTLKKTERIVKRRVVSAPYHFRFTVKPGTYRLTAPGDIPVTVQVAAGQTVRVRLKTKCYAVG